jgi:hypothetical protein
MKVFVGGVAAAFLGLIGVLVFIGPFLNLIAGAIPLVLLLGGAMAAYLGYDEVKEKLPFPKNRETQDVGSEPGLKEEAEKYRQEVERLKAELEKSKTA